MCFRVRCILTIFISIVFLSLSLACEVDTKVSVDGRNPPTFSFEGSGYLTFFTVEEIAPENQNVPDVEQDRAKNRTIWSIWPSRPLDTPLKKTAPITYGKVPIGFYQKIPQDGQPPTLAEGKVYEAVSVHPLGMLLQDGTVVRPEAQLVGEDGKTYELTDLSLWGEAVVLSNQALPRSSNVNKLRIRSDKPIQLSQVIFNCYNYQDVKR